ncbi:MAG: hypothetical protein LC772_11810 [Chloroflexi bacterium]|nr:hypothetical protein [Chloroflexota bacterium]
MISKIKRIGIMLSLALPVLGIGTWNTVAQATGTAVSDTVNVVAHANVKVANIGGDSAFTVNVVTKCTIASDGADESPCTLTASGTVHNTACGTGTVDVTAITITEGDGATISGSWTGIPFAAGEGSVVAKVVVESDSTGPATFTGQISAVPDAPSGDGFCTDGFTFSASGSVTETAD